MKIKTVSLSFHSFTKGMTAMKTTQQILDWPLNAIQYTENGEISIEREFTCYIQHYF